MAQPASHAPAAGSGCHAVAELRVQKSEEAWLLCKCKQLHLLKGAPNMQPLFLDFDTLRHGHVPYNRFEAVLVQTGVKLPPQELDVLCQVYGVDGKPDRVSYKQFMQDLATADPAGATSPPRGHNAGSMHTLDRVMARFAADAGQHGLDLRSAFADFDRLRSGTVTVKQFQRSLPFEVNARESEALAEEYLSRDAVGGAGDDRVNYQRFVHDVEALRTERSGSPRGVAALRSKGSPISHPPAVQGVDEVLQEIRRQVKQTRARISEAMVDFDKLRCGRITQMQFESCLGRLKLHRINLDEQTLRMISARYVVAGEGPAKVQYTKFCQDIDEVFAIQGLEKNPSARPVHNDEDFKNDPAPQALSDEDEASVASIMARIRNVVSCRRMMLMPIFQDFDRATKGVYQTRTTSKSRFNRVLALNNIPVSEADCALLGRKYEARGDASSVNYVLFCRQIDELQPQPQALQPKAVQASAQDFVSPKRKGADTGLADLIDDIRAQVLTQRVRVSEFLRDYDKLRSGVVQKAQFASAMSMAKIELTAGEVEKIAAYYAAANRVDCVRWMQFADEVDEVFTTKGLESSPSKSAARQTDIQHRMAQEKEARRTPEMERILEKLKSTVKARGILLPPFFRDFDVHNSGLISTQRMTQAMSRHGFELSPQELATIFACYSDPRSRDICWRRLIQDIDEFEDGIGSGFGLTSPKRALPVEAPSPLRGTGASPEAPPSLEDTLNVIRAKVVKNRIRVKDFFTDSDRLRKGHISAAKFRTGLDIAGLSLTPMQLDVLEMAYMNVSVEGHVDYAKFVAEVIAEAHLQNLEKNPAAGGVAV